MKALFGGKQDLFVYHMGYARKGMPCILHGYFLTNFNLGIYINLPQTEAGPLGRLISRWLDHIVPQCVVVCMCPSFGESRGAVPHLDSCRSSTTSATFSGLICQQRSHLLRGSLCLTLLTLVVALDNTDD